ncbi:helix-turn-helix transcriptional regulator [Roseateles flavus]|uniref:AlpA family phage regulatory protein n=1 Tax=Roseateles flavus TaxID=3149041 RepID=A0ABV0GG58_9BURK
MSFANIILNREQAAEAMSLALSTFEEGVRQGLYPRPRKLSANRVGWLRKDLERAAEALPESDLPPPPNTGASKRKAKAEA